MSKKEKIKNDSVEDTDSGEKKSFSEKFNGINQMVENKTKELKIFNLLLPMIVYFLFFLIFESVF
jgi:hypothetical protein